eukprot:6466881-Alexandrium_andersonii.AAC.1
MSVVGSVFSAASAASFRSSSSSGQGSSARSKTPLPRPSFLRRGVGKHGHSRMRCAAIPRRMAARSAGG